MEQERIDKRIIAFIKKHHVLTLATAAEGAPYCSNLFYTYLEEKNVFVFTSSENTRHAAEMKNDGRVAGSVVLETEIVGKIQGLQFQGIVLKPEGELLKAARTAYLKRFPFAVFMDVELWVLELTFAKLTDNRLGFGRKLVWERDKK
ncbi:MAG TPA: pyridoxamine 5'-phosphate oxidase family protein [Candidatus Avirikenella pullistercoris]|nr:pyridoxamine 5'-phosphate oxidase family protein [Candidatus Avirikenella pullistercoris]